MTAAKAKVETMNVRQFLRGGYREDRGQPTVVLNGDVIAGIWWSGTSALRIVEPQIHRAEPEERKP